MPAGDLPSRAFIECAVFAEDVERDGVLVMHDLQSLDADNPPALDVVGRVVLLAEDGSRLPGTPPGVACSIPPHPPPLQSHENSLPVACRTPPLLHSTVPRSSANPAATLLMRLHCQTLQQTTCPAGPVSLALSLADPPHG